MKLILAFLFFSLTAGASCPESLAPDFLNLKEVKAFIAEKSQNLDPNSRYIKELLEMVEGSKDIQEFKGYLLKESRGSFFTTPAVFSKMSLKEQILANLITNETTQERFSEKEFNWLEKNFTQESKTQVREMRILSLPCSNGSEAYTLAKHLLKNELSNFQILGMDIQPEIIKAAQSGDLLSPHQEHFLIPEEVRSHLLFQVGDVFKDPLPPSLDLIVSRNFLGYFKPEDVAQILKKYENSLLPGGYLFVDDFILLKHPELFQNLKTFKRVDRLPIFKKL